MDGPVVIRTHVLETHEVTLDPIEGSTQIGTICTLADGRVWMRELRPEDRQEDVCFVHHGRWRHRRSRRVLSNAS